MVGGSLSSAVPTGIAVRSIGDYRGKIKAGNRVGLAIPFGVCNDKEIVAGATPGILTRGNAEQVMQESNVGTSP